MLGFPAVTQVIKLVFDIRLPGDVVVSNGDIGCSCSTIICSPNFECVVEVTLRDEATREGRITWNERSSIERFILAKVSVSDDRVTVAELTYVQLVAHKLLV